MTVKHKPYVEYRTPPQSDNFLTGGIDTSAYDRFRQGVSITTVRHEYLVRPKMWSGDTTHHLQRQVFGVSGLYPDGDAYDDVKRQFNQVDVINYITSGALVPVSTEFYGAGDDDGNIEQFDGVIEPLTIRKLVINLDKSERNRVRAYYSLGNYSRWESTDDVFQESAYGPQQGNAFKDFSESVDEFGDVLINGTGPLLRHLQKLTTEDKVLLSPYDDTVFFTKWTSSDVVVDRQHMLQAFLQLAGSSE